MQHMHLEISSRFGRAALLVTGKEPHQSQCRGRKVRHKQHKKRGSQTIILDSISLGVRESLAADPICSRDFDYRSSKDIVSYCRLPILKQRRGGISCSRNRNASIPSSSSRNPCSCSLSTPIIENAACSVVVHFSQHLFGGNAAPSDSPRTRCRKSLKPHM